MALKLPRLRRGSEIVNAGRSPSEAFALLWDRAMTALEDAFNGLQAAVDAIAAAQAAADAANAAAAAAEAAAESVGAVAEDLALQNSYTTGLTVTAADAGASVTITISAHTRVYGDGTSVSVNSGALTGIPYSVNRWIRYDQASRAGGAVTYVAETTPQAQSGIRHVVGAVTTPAAAGPPVNGNVVLPPGYLEP